MLARRIKTLLTWIEVRNNLKGFTFARSQTKTDKRRWIIVSVECSAHMWTLGSTAAWFQLREAKKSITSDVAKCPMSCTTLRKCLWPMRIRYSAHMLPYQFRFCRNPVSLPLEECPEQPFGHSMAHHCSCTSHEAIKILSVASRDENAFCLKNSLPEP